MRHSLLVLAILASFAAVSLSSSSESPSYSGSSSSPLVPHLGDDYRTPSTVTKSGSSSPGNSQDPDQETQSLPPSGVERDVLLRRTQSEPVPLHRSGYHYPHYDENDDSTASTVVPDSASSESRSVSASHDSSPGASNRRPHPPEEKRGRTSKRRADVQTSVIPGSDGGGGDGDGDGDMSSESVNVSPLPGNVPIRTKSAPQSERGRRHKRLI